MADPDGTKPLLADVDPSSNSGPFRSGTPGRRLSFLLIGVAFLALLSLLETRGAFWEVLILAGLPSPQTPASRAPYIPSPLPGRFPIAASVRAVPASKPSLRLQFLQRNLPHAAPAPNGVALSSSSATESESTTLFPQQLNVLYDSKCSVCDVEINLLKQQDTKNQLRVTDIEDPNYDENDPKNGYVSYEEGMKVIHAVLPDGSTLKGYAVFPAMYKAIGLGWVWPSAENPVLGPVINTIAKYWFQYRTVITRGESLESIFAKRCETCGPLGGKATPDAKASVVEAVGSDR